VPRHGFYGLEAAASDDSAGNRAFEGGLVYVVTSGLFWAVG